METQLSRSKFLRLVAASASLLVLPRGALADDTEITFDMVVNDPDAPTAGNPNGNLTFVDFFDYDWPYCKMGATNLERLVKTDGNIRLAYKDWPILTETSIVEARLAFSAKYQGQYLAVHQALMDIPGYGISQERMLRPFKKRVRLDLMRS